MKILPTLIDYYSLVKWIKIMAYLESKFEETVSSTTASQQSQPKELYKELRIERVSNGYIVSGRSSYSTVKIFPTLNKALKGIKKHFKELEYQIKMENLKK